MDVRATVKALAGMGVHVHCLALGAVDLTSEKMTMQVLGAVSFKPANGVPARWCVASLIGTRSGMPIAPDSPAVSLQDGYRTAGLYDNNQGDTS